MKKHDQTATNKNISRREFMLFGGLALGSLVLPRAAAAQTSDKSKQMLLYIGTYTTNGKSEGIYIYKFDAQTGDLKFVQVVKNVQEPSYLAIGGKSRQLFAVNELVEYEGEKSGAVSSFAIDQKTGGLTFLNKVSSRGGAPCYITVSRNGKFALAANYVGGNVSVFPVLKDGKLGAALQTIAHAGTGPNKDRQEAAHAHAIVLDRGNRFAFAADLGIDKLMIYAFDEQTGMLKPNPAQEFYQTRPGAGPRHFTFHPNGKLAFLINELDLTVTSLAYDEKTGTLKEIQTVPTLPEGASSAGVSCADIHVSPDGKFLYGSNRGHDSLVGYRIDEKTGRLEIVGHTPTGGKKPRNFVISPDGKFVLAANQDSDNVVVFRLDEKTGKLEATGKTAQVPTPVCLKFIPTFNG